MLCPVDAPCQCKRYLTWEGSTQPWPSWQSAEHPSSGTRAKCTVMVGQHHCGQTFSTQPWRRRTSRKMVFFSLYFFASILWENCKFYNLFCKNSLASRPEFIVVVCRHYKPLRTHTLKLDGCLRLHPAAAVPVLLACIAFEDSTEASRLWTPTLAISELRQSTHNRQSPRSLSLRDVSIQKRSSRISQLSRRKNGPFFPNTNL